MRSEENREILSEGENIVEKEPEEQSGNLNPPISHSMNIVQDDTSVTGNKIGPSEDSGQPNATCIVPDVQHISSSSAGHTALDPFQSSDSDSSSPEQLSFLELSVHQGRRSPVTEKSHDFLIMTV